MPVFRPVFPVGLAAACGAPPPHRGCVLPARGGAPAAVAGVPSLLDLPCAARGPSRRRPAACRSTRWRPAATSAAPPVVVAVKRSRRAPSTPSPASAAVRAGARPARPPTRAGRPLRATRAAGARRTPGGRPRPAVEHDAHRRGIQPAPRWHPPPTAAAPPNLPPRTGRSTPPTHPPPFAAIHSPLPRVPRRSRRPGALGTAEAPFGWRRPTPLPPPSLAAACSRSPTRSLRPPAGSPAQPPRLTADLRPHRRRRPTATTTTACPRTRRRTACWLIKRCRRRPRPLRRRARRHSARRLSPRCRSAAVARRARCVHRPTNLGEYRA